MDISLDHTHVYLSQGLVTHQTINFLTGYGGGAFGLQGSLAMEGVYLSLEECERLLEEFFDTYPYLRIHIGKYKSFIEENGVAVSLTGRVRIFEEVFGEDMGAKAKALRAGYNHLIQSSASDIMLICLYYVEALMREAKLKSMLVTTVHDSLGIDTCLDELPQVHEIADAVVNNIPELLAMHFGPNQDLSWTHIVPLAGDSEVGTSYGNPFAIDRDPNWKEVYEKLAVAV